jgi:hypothetical protein
MKISDYPCPKCGSRNMWSQMAKEGEPFSYRVCQNSTCDGKIKVQWDEVKQKILVTPCY